jgi:hypothetical protein
LTSQVVGTKTYNVATGTSGKVYAVRGSEDGTKLEAAPIDDITNFETIVTLDGTNLKYNEKSEAALDLLNKADHNLLGENQTLTAKLAFDVESCNDVPYTIKNSVFYVKFLRPVSAKPGQSGELRDASNGASITSLVLNLVDWRDKKFDVQEDYTGEDGKTMYNFYGFYGVEKVGALVNDATTDLNNGTLGTTKLSDVTSLVKLYFGEDKASTDDEVVFTYDTTETSATPVSVTQPKFYYHNNGTTLGAFTVRVPLIVYYKWGKIYTYVDLKINQTINN